MERGCLEEGRGGRERARGYEADGGREVTVQGGRERQRKRQKRGRFVFN